MESTSIAWGTYRGPVAPDPLKQFNRFLDKAAKYTLLGKENLKVARRIGDSIAKVFGW